MYALVILSLVSAIGIVAFALRWAFARSFASEQFEFFRCRACGQKIRFLSSKAGQMGMCPRCKERWTLPKAPTLPSLAHVANSRYPARVGQVIRRNSWYRGRVAHRA